MKLVLPGEVLDSIIAHSEKAYPQEGCGLLIGELPKDFCGSDGEIRIVETRDFANSVGETNRNRSYQIDPQKFAQVELELSSGPLDIVGVYHSHPDVAAWPSPFDLERAWPCYLYLIASVRKGRFAAARAWRLSEDGRSFEEQRLNVLSTTGVMA